MEKTLYDVLGIIPSATDETIVESYRRLMAGYHPDNLAGLAPDLQKLAEERVTEVHAAYYVLSDPGRRASYDASLNLFEPSAQRPVAKSIQVEKSDKPQKNSSGLIGSMVQEALRDFFGIIAFFLFCVVGVGGFLIGSDWAEIHHQPLNSISDRISAALDAVADTEYMESLIRRVSHWKSVLSGDEIVTKFKEVIIPNLENALESKITYSEISSTGPMSLSIKNVVLTNRDKDILIKSVDVSDIDLDAIDSGKIPEHLTIAVSELGFGKWSLPFVKEYFDKENPTLSGTLSLSTNNGDGIINLDLGAQGLGHIQLESEISGPSGDKFTSINNLETALIKNVEIKYDDYSLLNKLLQAAAKTNGMSIDSEVLLVAARIGYNIDDEKIAHELERFLTDHESHKGILYIYFKSPKGTQFKDLAEITKGSDWSKNGFVITYKPHE